MYIWIAPSGISKNAADQLIGRRIILLIQGGYHKYREISFLRGFAITTIVLMHLIQVCWNRGEIPYLVRSAASLGGTGGHVFIFCSGFGLYMSQLHHMDGFATFMKKRFLKIYVPYILVVLLVYVLPHGTVDEAERFRMLLSHIFLYKMFIEKYICSFGLQLWFISTILQLYLLFIPICRLRRHTSMPVFVVCSLIVSAVWWVCMHYTGLEAKRIWGSFCFQYLWEFVLGIAAAEYLYTHDSLSVPLPALAAAAVFGLGLQAIMSWKGGYVSVFNDIPGLLGYGATALLLYHYGERLLRPVFCSIDTVSYEWYLLHTAVISQFYAYSRPVIHSEFLLAVSATLLSLLAAWLYAQLLGFMDRVVRMTGSRQPLN